MESLWRRGIRSSKIHRIFLRWKSGRQNQPQEKSQLQIMSEKFHKPGGNHLTEGYVVTPHTDELLKKHLKETGGNVITRFPPEPNGYLHIGHAMAMNFSFRYAEIHGGLTYLRYDDTNPETIREEYVRDIREMVEWLGFFPDKVTHASDYFTELYVLAVKLVREGHAYVCHQEALQGKVPTISPWRDRPVQESLQLLEDMRKGKFKEGEATLRMKVILTDGKQDPVAYRIKNVPHPRTEGEWCIYPLYDYAHCLCDSLENVTHSFCSKEFMAKRASYYWLCNALNVYCPVQWEFSRLNISNTQLSKRRILSLIKEGIVKDWTDPRLFTLTALRRRGVPPEAIKEYCEQYGVLQSTGEVDMAMVNHFVRKRLELTARRTMIVVDPIKVTISNFPWPQGRDMEVPNNSHEPSAGTRKVRMGPVIYLERSDFRQDSPKGYRRLTPMQPLGLKHADLDITLMKVIEDPTSHKVLELIVSCHQKKPNTPKASRPKAYAHWVSDSIPCTMRFYRETCSGDKLGKDSLVEMTSCLADKSVADIPVGETFQAERIGYFCKDSDSSPEALILNRTISLYSKSEWDVFSEI